MRDKVFENVEAILAGKRMKFLDPTRKAVLALPLAPFKLWHTYWSFENDAQEAYPSMATLMATSKMSKPTIIKARTHLLDTGWLIKLTGSAALRYIKASNGSWNISVYRVNDPTTKAEEVKELYQGEESLHLDGTGVKEMTVQQSLPNGASTGTVTGTVAGTISSPHTETSKAPASERVDSILSLRESRPAPSETRPEKKQPVRTPPITAPPPTLFNCPACDLTHRKGYYVAEHIEKEHPEQGEQTFRLNCPHTECWQRWWWNLIDNNKAKAEADLIDHLEVQHNPNSPCFAPMDACDAEGCYTVLPRAEMAQHKLICKVATQSHQ
jgi:hypothetical protein